MFFHRRQVPGIAPPGKDAAMYGRVQGLYPAIHHFGKPGMIGDIFYIETGVAHRFRSAAGRKNFNAMACEKGGVFHQAGFVGYGNQSPPDSGGLVSHRIASVACPFYPDTAFCVFWSSGDLNSGTSR